MAELVSPAGTLSFIPDDVTLAQFILDAQHPLRPVRKHGAPWIIEDNTGKGVGCEELRARTYGLANGMKSRFNIKENDVVLLFSPNHVDYMVATWAAHRLGAIMSGANPSFTSDELTYQIQTTRATVLIVHPESLSVALAAAQNANLPADRIVLFDGEGDAVGKRTTVQELIDKGLASPPSFLERTLEPGEGRTKVAFLSFSSGTTGRPKPVAIPHYAAIANVIQVAAHNRVNDGHVRWEEQRFRAGDVCSAAVPFYHIYGLVVNTHYIFFCGMSIVLTTSKFNFLDFLKSIVKHRMTHLMLVPPQVILFCKHPAVKDYDLSHVHYLTSGGAPISGQVMEQLVSILPNAYIGQSYRSTETCGIVTTFPMDKPRDVSGSAGQIVPGIIARVERPDGTLADFDEPGELVVKTPSVTLGYVGDPEATKGAFVNGWFRTGDEMKSR